MSNITITNNTSLDMFEMMEKGYRFAEIIAKADIIPVHYRMKPANVFIAVQSAYRMNLDPMLVMQNTFVISGKLGMNTTFALSLANKSGLFESNIRYREEGIGDNLKVTAYASLKKGGEEISYTISMKQAKAEGWTSNKKYQTLPELMLRYRAATFLIRTHMPEVLNGMHMVEELEDVTSAKAQDVTPKTQTLSARLDNLIVDEIEAVEVETIEVKAVQEVPQHENVIHEAVHQPQANPLSTPLPDAATQTQGELYVELLETMYGRNIPDATRKRWLERGSEKAGKKLLDIRELEAEDLQACINLVRTGKFPLIEESESQIEGPGYE